MHDTGQRGAIPRARLQGVATFLGSHDRAAMPRLHGRTVPVIASAVLPMCQRRATEDLPAKAGKSFPFEVPMTAITTKRDLIAALWDLWSRIDPQGVGQLCEFTDDEAADITKARLQALIDSDLGDFPKP
jgi:hypothetical protein